VRRYPVTTPESVPAPVSKRIILAALDAEVRDGAVTEPLRDYLTRLVTALWEEGEGFSGKRPLGGSGWQWGVYAALVRANLVTGTLGEDGDDIDLEVDQVRRADRIVCAALAWCLRRGGRDTL